MEQRRMADLSKLALITWIAIAVVACGDDDDGRGGVGGDASIDSGADSSSGSGGTGGMAGSGGGTNNDGGDNDAQVSGMGGAAGTAGTAASCEDVDQDGYSAVACGGDDCNDGDPNVNPGQSEICNNGINDDCRTATIDRFDGDNDGYDCVIDCNDDARSIHPGRPEVCGNAIDDDCNAATLDVQDLDNDGFGCDVDCDETRWDVNPAADEICGNNLDDDCDDTTDDVGDADNDGVDCRFDCDDTSASLPDSSGYCGTTYSYFEGFEAGNGGWVASGQNVSWQRGIPAGEVINTAGGGQHAWVTGIDPTGYQEDEVSFLTSPRFDFSVLARDPILQFSRIADFGSFDGVWLEVSVDNGVSWNRALETSFDQNLYDDDDTYGFVSSPTWLTALTRLEGVAGNADVRLRFVMFSDDGLTYEGFGLDNVFITDERFDLSLDAVTLPAARCADRSAETVNVTVTNLSTAAISELEIRYSIDGAAPITEVVTTTLQPIASTVLTLTVPANLTSAGPHIVRASVHTVGATDADATNNSAQASTYTFANASDLDYAESFEQGDGNWVGLGVDSSWERGRPAGDPIDGAADGQFAWVTNPYGVHNPNETSALYSPCFDFSELSQDPMILFSHLYSLDTDARHTLELSVDGAAFTPVGSATSPTGVNWYNDSADNAWNGPSGERGQWRVARHLLNQTAGRSNVQVRFAMNATDDLSGGVGIDDVNIVRDVVEATLTALTFPEIECEGRNSAVQLSIANTGTVPLTDLTVSYQVDGGTPVVETFAGPIAVSGSATYAFTELVTLTNLGAHTITARIEVDGQLDTSNTELTAVSHLQPVVSGLNYREGFEADAGQWITVGENSEWERGQPAAPFSQRITSAGSGQYAWVTRLYGAYSSDAEGDLVSPCLDFSAYSTDPTIRFDHIFDTDIRHPMWLEMTTDGLTWERVDASGQGTAWYNETHLVNGSRQWSGSYAALRQWHPASEILPDTAGEARVQLRFRFMPVLANLGRDGHGIDSIAIDTNFVDVSIVPLDLPATSCGGDFTVGIVNNGTAPVSNFVVTYQIDSNAPVADTVTAAIAAGDTYQYALPSLALGQHTVSVSVELDGDLSANNDSTSGTTNVRAAINPVGYAEDFEANDGGWVASGTNDSWAWGTPTTAAINSAASGTRAWVTNLSDNYGASETSILTSGCFNFANFATNPSVQFAQIFRTESGYDGAWLEISYNGGVSFFDLGTQSSGTNWYGSGNWWSGNSGGSGWRTASHPINVAGVQGVVFRFVFTSDGTIHGEGVGIDDFAIVP